MKLLLLIGGLLALWSPCGAEIDMEVVWDGMNGRFSLRYGNSHAWNVIAWGTFNDNVTSQGWGFMNIETTSRNGQYLDVQQAYAAGLLEAYFTRDLIGKQWRNEYTDYCLHNELYCTKLDKFLNDQLDYMIKNVRATPNDPFWYHVGLTLTQLAGIQSGMVSQKVYVYVDDNLTPNVSAVMQLSLHGDLFDLENVLGKVKEHAPGAFSSCSGLIKVTKDNQDILAGHTTWTGYNTMLRIQKKFQFDFARSLESSEKAAGNGAAFSSYPGRIISGDDFYALSSGLLVSETTIENNNASLYQYTTPTTVPSWVRNTVANRLARTAEEWAKLYAYNNSGTYNNQWMVIDYNKFTPGKPIQAGTFHVLEQMPGYVHHEDMSQFLEKNGHWPSYNTAYFPDIFNISGQWALVAKYGDWYTYDKTPRALIFKRDQGKVTDLESLRKMLRYNDFQHDPLSACNCTPPYSSENAIASRNDLNPVNGTYPFSALGHRPRGATDVKVTNSTMLRELAMVIQSGPTNDQQPTFKWSMSDFNTIIRHEGHPDVWDFPPVYSQWMKI